MKAPVVLVILVTSNGMSYIRNCLSHLAENIDPGNILVVDNASKDETVKFIEEHYSKVTLVNLATNQGLARACNVGLKLALAAKIDYVFLVNQDVYVGSNTIATLVEIAVRHEEYGILSPMHLNATGDGPEEGFALVVPPMPVSDLFADKSQEIFDCRLLNATAWLISRKCLETTGGFDPLFLAWEAEDYIKRTTYFNWRTGVCPSVNIRLDKVKTLSSTSDTDERRMYFDVLGQLKDPGTPFQSATAFTCSRLLLKIGANLVRCRFRQIKPYSRVLLKVLWRFNGIRKSRRACQKPGAFLAEQ
jgi:glycosyltransferase involved in cell wall biosynthesis